MKLKTRKIAGWPVRLRVGRRYRASRPMVSGVGRIPGPVQPVRLYPVSVRTIDEGKLHVEDIGLMTYKHANTFLRAFNNGKTSFAGRIWR